MPSRRVRFRPPGVKPWTRIGPLGPARGRLGLAWVIAPLVVGVALAVAIAVLLLSGGGPPGVPFVPVGALESFPEGSARAVTLPGVHVGRTGSELFAVRAFPGCSLELCAGRYVDCRGAAYGIDGRAVAGPGALARLPVRVHDEIVYVDPEHPGPSASAQPVPGLPVSRC